MEAASSVISIEESEGTSFFVRAAAALRLLLLLPTLGEKLQTALSMTHLQYTPRTTVPRKTDTVLCYRSLIHASSMEGLNLSPLANDSGDNDTHASL